MPRSDSFILGGTSTMFQQRVEMSLLSACININSEGIAVNNHSARLALVHSILASPAQLQNYAQMFALTVATDASVLADATQNSTVVLSSVNVSTQQALVTDAHIDTAVSGQFNAYCGGIQA